MYSKLIDNIYIYILKTITYLEGSTSIDVRSEKPTCRAMDAEKLLDVVLEEGSGGGIGHHQAGQAVLRLTVFFLKNVGKKQW